MPAPGAAGVGDGSEGKVRAGAGVGGGPERKNILCPPPDAPGGEVRGVVGGE